MTPAETLAKSQQLDSFLGKAVKDIKSMNKLEELAARSAALNKAVEDRADRMAARLDALPALIDRAFGPQEAKLDDLERGADLLEKSLHSMIGHNGSPPLKDLPLPSPVSPPAIDPPEPEPIPMTPSPMPTVEPAPAVDPTATGNPLA